MINWEQVKQLEEDIGAEDFGDVVEMFIMEVDEAVDNLRGVQSMPDADLGPALHFLKGSAANLGFRDFADCCASGEKQADAGAGSAVDLGRVVDLYDQSKQTFLQSVSMHTQYAPASG